jgi:hypothetical protein
MAGTSPNALANIGEGASKGLSAYGESKKAIAGRMDKLDELRGRMEEAQRTEAVAAANFGFNSVEHKQAANEKRVLEKQAAKLSAGIHGDENKLGYEKIAAEREGQRLTAGSAAASLAERKQYHDLLSGKGGLKGMTANQLADTLNDRIQGLNKDEIAINSNDDLSPEEKEYQLANIKGVRNGYRKQILSVAKGNNPDFSYLEELDSVINTPYSPQSIPQPGAVVKPAPIGKTSVSNW